MHEEKMYPPKVTVMVYSNSTSTASKKTHTFTVEITGIREKAFNINIAKDFGAGTQLMNSESFLLRGAHFADTPDQVSTLTAAIGLGE